VCKSVPLEPIFCVFERDREREIKRIDNLEAQDIQFPKLNKNGIQG
jgi:hypothetical protein